jgi:hypothetical protein
MIDLLMTDWTDRLNEPSAFVVSITSVNYCMGGWLSSKLCGGQAAPFPTTSRRTYMFITAGGVQQGGSFIPTQEEKRSRSYYFFHASLLLFLAPCVVRDRSCTAQFQSNKIW